MKDEEKRTMSNSTEGEEWRWNNNNNNTGAISHEIKRYNSTL